MGKQIPVWIFTYFFSIFSFDGPGQNLTISGINASPAVLGKKHLLTSIIAVINQFLLMGCGIINNIAGHGKQ